METTIYHVTIRNNTKYLPQVNQSSTSKISDNNNNNNTDILNGRKPLEILRSRREDNIRMDLKEIG